MTLKQKQKEEALKRMATLKLMPNVIKDFKTNGKIYYSERQNAIFNAVLYWLDNKPEYVAIVDEFEKKHNALVYHCQLTYTEFGEQLTLFYVSENEDEWEMDNRDLEEMFPLVYVANISEPLYSEFGSIGIRPSMGGVLRTA